MADRTSRTKKNKFSLEGLKEARAGGVSRLDQLEVISIKIPHVLLCLNIVDTMYVQLEDEGDVYEMVDEDQYANLVERRRNEDDFVVDDSKIYC